MGGELTKLSETRWRYATGKRVYYLKQLKAPVEEQRKPGLYRVDGGGGDVCVTTAGCVEEITYNLSRSQSPNPQLDPAPW